MERERTPPIANTKRCLFPEDDLNSQVSSDIFHVGSVDSPLMKGTESHDDSPTTVQAYPVHSAQNNTSIKSRIAMGDHGAEVLVDMSLLSIHTPEKEETFRRTNSLLDTRSSPAFSKDDSFVFHVVEDSPFGKCYHNSNGSPFGLQTSIALCLGDVEEDFQAAASGCNSWGPWSYFSSGEEKNQSLTSSPPKNRLTNRAFNQEARKIRIQHIRRELNPFQKSPQTPKQFAKARSFSVTKQALKEKKETRRCSKSQTRIESSPPSRGISDVIQLCTMPENVTANSPMIIRKNEDFEHEEKKLEVFYDSDPEDFTRTSRRTLRKRNRKTGVYERGEFDSSRGHFEDIYNDEVICTVSQEFVNSNSTLIYHRTNTTGSSQVVVNAWVERGQDFGQSLVQPKWMWKPQLEESKSRQSMHQVNAVDLLSITRILKVDQIDRLLYPFAKPSSCFLVRTVDGDGFLFEAESEMERDQMIYSMKMVIARFGAMVLNQDEAIHEEFFATSEPVPGAIPAALARINF
ncbi:unnamed protein product [Cylindrotheca closterium]|uniref:Uncharacterized protein n=1 Tax=Cylindrotheca closterium TaxID=2856 RepID=A0AAD2GAM6_9STRA|nr:unnamed protein product [Cylindrotheca closterium]